MYVTAENFLQYACSFYTYEDNETDIHVFDDLVSLNSRNTLKTFSLNQKL